MERVSDQWLAHEIEEVMYPRDVKSALQELQMRRRVDRAHSVDAEATQERENPVLPIPCTKGFEEWTVKEYFQKINEELDELKERSMVGFAGLNSTVCDAYCSDGSMEEVADEAADTITAITSMLEAMGIDEQMRQEAQRRVNERNRERGRIE